MENLWDIIIILASLGGFFLAFYIRAKKHKPEAMVCPLHGSCNTVTTSEYSSFFGFPVEMIGMVYYGFIATSYIILLAFPYLSVPIVNFLLLGTTIVAFLFSVYLTLVQGFALRQWCTWCLTSAGLSTLIFALSIAVSTFGTIELLSGHRDIIIILHAIGFALGLGGASITDIFFFKFLKDLRISEWEADVMRTLSQVMWFALGIIILSGIGLFLPEAERLLASSKFLVKMVVVSVLIVNGILLNLFVSPKLVKISFGKKHHHEPGELHHLRKLAFAFGGISFVSWYSAFILGMLRHVPLSFPVLLGIYVVLLTGAIIGSQITERRIARQSGE